MNLAVAGSVVAWLAVLAGLSLALAHAVHRPVPSWLAWLHPLAATVAVVSLWIAVARWPGPSDQFFNSGVFLVTLALVAGGFLFSLRKSGLPLPLLAIGLHGAIAIGGCVLLIDGLLRAHGVA